eukprot:TRINITY_DN981_c2_g2_i2.p1 TRINITY_DN981_c2_g2~~TRINITY_DN981_c2_g2_i2.p1  ORF type:complete len:146 (+),score=27.93 TRINITY_DN981_c2_g2_i2:63-500(+)
MALRATKPALIKATQTALAANPYFHFPRDVTRTVLRENWRFTGMWLMLSQREQMEYRKRNHSYGNYAIWWQSHFDAILISVGMIGTIIFFFTSYGYQWVRSFGYNTDRQRAIYQILHSFGTRNGTPGSVWFEEEARQKKIGLFFE